MRTEERDLLPIREIELATPLNRAYFKRPVKTTVDRDSSLIVRHVAPIFTILAAVFTEHTK